MQNHFRVAIPSIILEQLSHTGLSCLLEKLWRSYELLVPQQYFCLEVALPCSWSFEQLHSITKS